MNRQLFAAWEEQVMKTGRWSWVLMIIFSLQFLIAEGVLAQSVRVNQRKIERKREQRKKKDMKAYQKAVKRHMKMQSDATRSSMKRTKKESKKLTPIRK